MSDEPPDDQDQWIRDFLAAEPERVRNLLAAVIKAAGQSQRTLERRLGWTHSTISNVLRGRVELKQVHVSGILLAIGFEPSHFYRLAQPRPLLLGHLLSAEDFERRLARLGLLPEEAPFEPPPPRLPQTVAELEAFVGDAVRKALAASGAPKRKRPRKPAKRKRPAKKG
jgi:transcriptional regulator with XRE-family HTH domain